MTSIFSLEQWREITSRGTSGDQVGDILASWESDRFMRSAMIDKLQGELNQVRASMMEAIPMLQQLHKVMSDLVDAQTTVSRQAETIKRLQSAVDAFETKEAECGHLDRWWKVEADDSAWCVMCALEKANAENARLRKVLEWIPVEKTLPEEGVAVEVQGKLYNADPESKNIVFIARRCGMDYGWVDHVSNELVERVTCWRPIPKEVK